jgi:hypothetical protein
MARKPPNMYDYIKNLQQNPKTSAVGSKWTREEEQKMLDSINKGLSFENIALEHKRTINGILYKINEISVRFLEEGFPIEEVAMKVNLSPDKIEIAKVKIEAKQEMREFYKNKSKKDKEEFEKNIKKNEMHDIIKRLERLERLENRDIINRVERLETMDIIKRIERLESKINF